MNQLNISDLTIDVIRKDIKNIHLAVYPPSGRIRIAAPRQMDDDAIRLFVVSKISWIKRQQRKFIAQERIPPREYLQRESHYFQGRRYLLNVIEIDAVPKVVIRGKRFIDLYIRVGATTEKKHGVMTEWHRNQLKLQIPVLITKWCKQLDVQVSEFQVKQMKTKWGSCNIEKRRILLNLELAKKPEICLEYIIVHELIHFKERHHNERFLYHMDKYLPNWRQIKTELNKLPVSHADWNY